MKGSCLFIKKLAGALLTLALISSPITSTQAKEVENKPVESVMTIDRYSFLDTNLDKILTQVELTEQVEDLNSKVEKLEKENKKLSVKLDKLLSNDESNSNADSDNSSNSNSDSDKKVKPKKKEEKKSEVKSKETKKQTSETSAKGQTYEATFYTAFCPTGCTGVTATGMDVSNSIYTPEGLRVVAVDPNNIPLGTIVKVTMKDGTTFKAEAADTGGDIKGNRIDILVESRDEAYRLGRQNVTVEVLK